MEQYLAVLHAALERSYERLDQVLAGLQSETATTHGGHVGTVDTRKEEGATQMSKLTLTTEGDRHVVVTRRFAAPPALVFRAHTEPALIQQWMLGPEGWTMPVCINEATPGGRIRFEWSDGKGGGFFLTGEVLEVVPYSRLVHVERMHLPDPTPDNHVETRFAPDGTGTLMTMRMTLPSAEVRQQMLATGMDKGMEASYVRLERVLSVPTP